jgi:HSP20 family molecular chaperone IbpA
MMKEKVNVKDTIGSILEGIERLAKLAENLQRSAENFSKEGEIDLSRIKEGMKASYSISFKTAVGSRAHTSTFSREFARKAAQQRNAASEVVVPVQAEPETDVFIEAASIKIYAQLPGVEEKDITLTLNKDILELEAKNAKQRFYKEILLPKPVQPESMEKRFHNGILEIAFILAV